MLILRNKKEVDSTAAPDSDTANLGAAQPLIGCLKALLSDSWLPLMSFEVSVVNIKECCNYFSGLTT